MAEQPPSRFERTWDAATIQKDFAHLEPGEECPVSVSVAGRIMLRRVQGKLAFATLAGLERPRSSCSPPPTRLPASSAFCDLHLGDWLGVTGDVMKTRKGELSVKVRRMGAARRSAPRLPRQVARPHRRRHALPAALRRPLGHRGRAAHVRAAQPRRLAHAALARGPRVHRSRDADLPPDPGRCDREAVRHAPQRARPRLVPAHRARAVPEAPRRRRVREGLRDRAASSATRASRPRHNPEFTMLELYEAYADYADIMRLIEELVAVPRHRAPRHDQVHLRRTRPRPHAAVAPGHDGRPRRGADRRRASISHADRRPARARRRARRARRAPTTARASSCSRSTRRPPRPSSGDPVFVMDYPNEVSPLVARPPRARRVSSSGSRRIVAGRELCNAFSELIDPDEQRARFEAQAPPARRRRRGGDGGRRGLPPRPRIRACRPPAASASASIALVMLLADAPTIRDVILFPTLRPEQD